MLIIPYILLKDQICKKKPSPRTKPNPTNLYTRTGESVSCPQPEEEFWGESRLAAFKVALSAARWHSLSFQET